MLTMPGYPSSFLGCTTTRLKAVVFDPLRLWFWIPFRSCRKIREDRKAKAVFLQWHCLASRYCYCGYL